MDVELEEVKEGIGDFDGAVYVCGFWGKRVSLGNSIFL